ncbi:MAG: hypothetical protein FJZ07_02785, partial [Candidatus Nealsonbacteria bacterium]|nr:hypothetical protein [Candidatus Nealsonbacteria bacterium]
MSPRQVEIASSRAIVEATRDLACAYYLDTASYEERGNDGKFVLTCTFANISAIAPGVPVIMDTKCASAGRTNAKYVGSIFGAYYPVDAVTLHPCLDSGAKTLQPFLERTDKGIFVSCSMAEEFRKLQVAISMEEVSSLNRANAVPWLSGIATTQIPMPVYLAHTVAETWNKNKNCGIVVNPDLS